MGPATLLWNPANSAGVLPTEMKLMRAIESWMSLDLWTLYRLRCARRREYAVVDPWLVARQSSL
jgi:hypothetical protein